MILLINGMCKYEKITCSFFGHKKIEVTEELNEKLSAVIENLIVNYGVTIFYFGKLNNFTELCYNVVTSLQKKYPAILKVKYNCLIKSSPLTEVSEERYNKEMINDSVFCVFYYNKKYKPEISTKSGTELALIYAKQKGKNIINLTYKKRTLP